jgi:hypothetical protein
MFLRETHPGEDQHKTTYSYYVEPYIRLPTATPIVRPRAVACLALDTHALAIRANNRHGQEGRQERVYPLHLVPRARGKHSRCVLGRQGVWVASRRGGVICHILKRCDFVVDLVTSKTLDVFWGGRVCGWRRGGAVSFGVIWCHSAILPGRPPLTTLCPLMHCFGHGHGDCRRDRVC